mgnify:CR=1 FL=1
MSEIEKILDNLITEKDYDTRLIPYIKQFFLYNINECQWNEHQIHEKAQILREKINGIDFVSLDTKLVSTDWEMKNILINDVIKSKELSENVLLELISKIFQELEDGTKENINSSKSSKLKYVINEQEQDRIFKFISNGLNVKTKDMQDIINMLQAKLKNKDINNAEKNFCEDCLTTILPAIDFSVDEIITGKNKAQNYERLYAIALCSISYRLENENEDKILLKQQYEKINENLSELTDEYVILMNDECKTGTDWTIKVQSIDNEIRNTLKDIDIGVQLEEETKTTTFKEGLSGKFIKEASNITKSEKLTELHIKERSRFYIAKL